jgi:hypothetical protein
MYAQLVRGRTSFETRMEVRRVVHELMPALRGEPGLAGALSLVDHGSGTTMMIVLWESADQARRPLGDGLLAPFVRNAGNQSGTDGTIPVWEVAVRV